MRKKRRGTDGEDRLSVIGRISRTLELPAEVLEGMPDIELHGNREAVVEHCMGVLEYNETIVRIDTGKMILRFTGRNLRLNCMTDESAVISGFFTDISFV